MKTSFRVPASRLSVLWWIWVLLVPLFVGGCKPRKPRELRCEPTAVFEALEPEQDAGAAPFSIERLGPQVESHAVKTALDDIIFTDGNNGHIDWMYADFGTYTEITYSPAEGVARMPDLPSGVYPMKRFSDGKSERVRVGYRSSVCLQMAQKEQYVYCKGDKYSEDERFLVVDLTCRPDEK